MRFAAADVAGKLVEKEDVCEHAAERGACQRRARGVHEACQRPARGVHERAGV